MQLPEPTALISAPASLLQSTYIRYLAAGELVHKSQRTRCYRVRHEGSDYLLKIFRPRRAATCTFRRERESNRLLSEYSWFSPWCASGYKWFLRRWHSQSLLQAWPSLSEDQKEIFARDALNATFDLYAEGLAHRDLHAKNFYIDDGKLRLVDFETVCRYPEFDQPRFVDCYDVTGEGLESPYATDHAAFASNKPHSVKNQLSVDFHATWDRVRELYTSDYFKEQLRLSCSTFQTVLGNRHRCSAERIYSSFSLPKLTVSSEEAQRNSDRRFAQFQIGRTDLEGMTVLDLGCNVGAMLFAAQQFSPAACLGVEYDHAKVRLARKIATINDLDNIRFATADIDRLRLDSNWDVVFCFSINRHVKNENRLYTLLGRHTKKLLLFEGNSGTNVAEAVARLKRAGFRDVLTLGTCDDDCVPANNVRPLIRAIK